MVLKEIDGTRVIEIVYDDRYLVDGGNDTWYGPYTLGEAKEKIKLMNEVLEDWE
jgi:hypothetical protein